MYTRSEFERAADLMLGQSPIASAALRLAAIVADPTDEEVERVANAIEKAESDWLEDDKLESGDSNYIARAALAAVRSRDA